MTDVRFELFGGPFDGSRCTYPKLLPSIWVGPCDCGSPRPCLGVTVMPPRALGHEQLRAIAAAEGYVEYTRDRLLPNGAWRYVYAEHTDTGGPNIVDRLLRQVERDKELVSV